MKKATMGNTSSLCVKNIIQMYFRYFILQVHSTCTALLINDIYLPMKFQVNTSYTFGFTLDKIVQQENSNDKDVVIHVTHTACTA